MRTVLISYSGKPQTLSLVKAISSALERAAYNVIDATFAGIALDTQFQEIVRRADIVLGLVEEDSPNVLFEVGYASGIGKHVLLVCQPNVTLSFDLRSFPSIQGRFSDTSTLTRIVAELDKLKPEEWIPRRTFSSFSEVLLTYFADPAYFESLEQAQFEQCLSDWFSSKGYEPRFATASEGEGDLILQSYGGFKTTVVDCKKLNKNNRVSISDIDKFLGAIQRIKADHGIFVATSDFTRAAVEYAKANSPRIELWDIAKIVNDVRTERRPERQHTEVENTTSVSSSGRWVFLHKGFYETKTVREKEGRIFLTIPTRSAEEEMELAGLRPLAHAKTASVAYAFGNDGLVVRVENVETISEGEETYWTITLAPEQTEYGGGLMESSLSMGGKTYSADEIATLRAGRILLNNPRAMQKGSGLDVQNYMLESFISGTGTKLSINTCILRAVYAEYRDRPQLLLPVARLAAIYALKAGDVVEQVLELSLGPIQDGKCQVKFRGRRRKKYSNVDPHVIQIDGECPLE